MGNRSLVDQLLQGVQLDIERGLSPLHRQESMPCLRLQDANVPTVAGGCKEELVSARKLDAQTSKVQPVVQPMTFGIARAIFPYIIRNGLFISI